MVFRIMKFKTSSKAEQKERKNPLNPDIKMRTSLQILYLLMDIKGILLAISHEYN